MDFELRGVAAHSIFHSILYFKMELHFRLPYLTYRLRIKRFKRITLTPEASSLAMNVTVANSYPTYPSGATRSDSGILVTHSPGPARAGYV